MRYPDQQIRRARSQLAGEMGGNGALQKTVPQPGAEGVEDRHV